MASVSVQFNPINWPHPVPYSPIRLGFLGENQLLLPADIGTRNIATALPFTHHVSMALKVKTAETKVKGIEFV